MRFDDGETQDLTAYNEYHFSASGNNPFIGTAHLDIEVSTKQKQSNVQDAGNEKMGSIVVYNAKLFSLSGSSKGLITLTSGNSVNLTVEYDKTNNICRFHQKAGDEVAYSDIKSIHITSS